MESCLQIRPSSRKTPEELLRFSLFEELLENDKKVEEENAHSKVIVRKMDELYYLWQLAGGDINLELKKQGLIRSRPPILSIPKYVFMVYL